MTATLASIQTKAAPTEPLISLEDFLENYTNNDDAFKYEWHNGIVEKTERTINRNQLPIVAVLMRLFCKTQTFQNGGLLTAEVDMFLPRDERTRRADLVYLSPELVKKAVDNVPTVCPFVIEIVSKNDEINENYGKLIEYFTNGVEVVWLIVPTLKKVEVYTSIRDVKICFDNDVCSAAPVLPDFNISVNDLFV